jgi:hypothetical protein
MPNVAANNKSKRFVIHSGHASAGDDRRQEISAGTGRLTAEGSVVSNVEASQAWGARSWCEVCGYDDGASSALSPRGGRSGPLALQGRPVGKFCTLAARRQNWPASTLQWRGEKEPRDDADAAGKRAPMGGRHHAVADGRGPPARRRDLRHAPPAAGGGHRAPTRCSSRRETAQSRRTRAGEAARVGDIRPVRTFVDWVRRVA